MTTPAGKYLLLWKGRQTGPFALDEIRAKLTAGEISRMHQIGVAGGWQVLDEFLEKVRPDPVRPLFPPHPLQPPSEPPAHTSRLAIAALIMGLCTFIPYVNFLTWILALGFGHTALWQMKEDETLRGRNLAIAGLMITYFVLVLGLTFVTLMVTNNQKLPF